MQTVLLISLGAIIGANLRYFVAQYVTALLPSSFPFGTLIINISASFVLERAAEPETATMIEPLFSPE